MNIQAVFKGLSAAYPIFQVIDRVPTIDLDDSTAEHIKSISGDIHFEDVSFRYKTRDQQVLDGVSLTLEEGKLTALVGPSGSGKSTLVKLLMRFYDPDQGQVTVNGKDLRSLRLRDFRRRIGYVGQEPCLLHESIRDNLLNANPLASEADIEEALRAAMALDFVEQLEEGVHTDVGAVGGKLSGGQKQRIAIARALVSKPDLLVFDEATSALDPENEQKVQAAIDKVSAETCITKVVIAHRLSTVINADKIVVFEGGRITGQGTHAELLETNKTYKKYYESQLKTEKVEHEFASVCSSTKTVSYVHNSRKNILSETEEDVEEGKYLK